MYQTLKKAIALLTPYERIRGIIVLLLVIGMAILETLGVASVMPFLAVLGNPDMLQTNTMLNTLYVKSHNFGIYTPDDFLILLGTGSFLFIILSAVFRTYTQYCMNRYIHMRQHSLALRLLETYLRQPYSFFLDRHSGDLSKTILSEVGSVIGYVFQPVINMAAYSLILIAITTMLLMVNPWLALLTAGLLGGLYVLVFLGLKEKLTLLGGTLAAANKERFLAASEVFGGIKDIKLLGREQSYLSRFQKPSHQFATTQTSHATLTLVPNYAIEAIIFGAMLLLTLLLMIDSGGLKSGALGQILPILGLYTFAAYRLKPAIQNIYQGFASLRFGMKVVDNLFSDIHTNFTPPQLPKTRPNPLKAKQSIELKNLSFIYPKSEKPALEDLNFNIPIGSSIGLVGSTGAGKTTLVDLILGLLRPTNGNISVDEIPISDDRLRSWQQSLGYVPQEIFLTDTTITENIALGIPNDYIDQSQVECCARMAQVHDFIVHDLPSKYQTLVGERGVRLSGGQRQRIGIARALYHNPEILVFDEATSALDTLTEQAVMDAIDSLAHQKTIILIAHRLSTVKNCDKIVLLENGVIKAIGHYDELIHENEHFRTMAGVH